MAPLARPEATRQGKAAGGSVRWAIYSQGVFFDLYSATPFSFNSGAVSNKGLHKAPPPLSGGPEASGLIRQLLTTCETILHNLRAHPRLTLLVLLAAVLLPFASKAFHIDDPLVIWSAKHISQHPTDFYGFDVNWFGVAAPMWKVNLNPPLTSYFLAFVGGVCGWGEAALHMSFLVWAFAFAVACYELACRWCKEPLLATVVSVFSPVFLVSATTLMTDLPMLAFWTWSMLLWVRGIDQRCFALMLGSVVLAALAILTKYTAITLLPLLLLYGVLARRNVGPWAATLLLPLALLTAYELYTKRLYGQGLMAVAGDYSSVNRLIFESGVESKWLIGLLFLGGCFLPTLFYSPILWKRMQLLTGLGVCIAVGALALLFEKLGPVNVSPTDGPRWGLLLQIGVLGATGAGAVVLAALAMRARDLVSLTLSAWVLGTFLFAVVLNWTVASRSFLPALPAFTILLLRAVEMNRGSTRTSLTLWAPVLPLALVTIWITAADFSLANTARSAARRIISTHAGGTNTIWFEGHWGFQFYMEAAGAKALDVKAPGASVGDVLVLPENNSNVFPLSERFVDRLGTITEQPCHFLATMNRETGAGYYAADWGPLPFTFGAVGQERYHVFVMSHPVPTR